MSPETLGRNIRYVAKQLGFDDCRFARAGRAAHADHFLKWVDDGHAGEMGWLERGLDRRCDPREVLPGCRTVVSLALNYFPGDLSPNEEYRIARYSWNDDYHDVIEDKLRDLDLAMQDLGGQQRFYVDTGPVLERDWASAAGVGWNGKSTVQIHRRLGTWFFLAELLTTLEVEPDEGAHDHCGKCVACMVACPTQAITAPHHLEARRCLSYLTIEHKGAIPVEFRRAMGRRIYGCDDCLEVCPWNRFAAVSREATFHAREEIFQFRLRDFLGFTVEDFRRVFAKSPIKRIKLERFLRNVCVALGNVGTEEDLPALRRHLEGESALVAEHAEWAISEIEGRRARTSISEGER